jgi:HEAT repeat protein
VTSIREQLWIGFRSGSPEARRRVVLEAGRLPAAEAADIVLLALADDDWRVRKEATALAARIADEAGVVEQLIAATAEEENIGLRNAAVEALSNAGDKAIGKVIGQVSSHNPNERRTAAEILGASRDPRAADVLIGALSDSDPNVRAAAAEWLGELSGERVAEALFGCLNPEDRLLSLVALQSLRKLDAAVPWSLLKPLENEKILGEELILALGRSGALEAVSRVMGHLEGEPAACIAMEQLHESSPETSRAVEAALGSMSGADAENLWKLAAEDDALYKRAATRCLLWARNPDDILKIVRLARNNSLYPLVLDGLSDWGSVAIDALISLLDHVDGDALASTLGLLTRLMSDEEGKRMFGSLAGFLSSNRASVSTAAAGSVARFGDHTVIPRLLDLIDSDDRRVRSAAGNALAEVGRRYPEEVLSALEGVEIEGGRGVEVCRALRVVGRRDAVPRVAAAMNDPSPELRKAALSTVAVLGGEAAIDSIIAQMADEEVGVRLSAVEALTLVGAPAAETIVSQLGTAEGSVAAALVRALGRVGYPDAAEVLVRASRKSADMALAAIEAARTLGIHLEAWQGELLAHDDVEVVMQTLSAFGKHIPVERLIEVVTHEDWSVRLAAVEQLALAGQEKKASQLLRERLEAEDRDSVRDALNDALDAIRKRGSH